ncbi:exonuclease SbcC [Buttiauxella sp. A2-C1_F]|uniref:exonuclease SbcC n=1 Tax=Buttiauxella sp. A2-C1_F TaxID=2904526 RepID=UPI001E2E914C|nr:exonuclease SbcC [Buttiauxella sp. A2-C1_F]MCE0845170.1 exonuclease SbcC [Buttiauxella sp. A2-C1_F]
MKSYININQLILVGFRKDYIIPFYQGINIIYGDSDTGKSSVLEFINYLLGASSIDLADEIKTSVKHAALEVVINDIVFTIKRDIFDPKKMIEVYRCEYKDVSLHFPKRYSPNYSSTQNNDGIYSEFLLDSLNFPKIEIKVSPSKKDSQLRRLSFRNIYKFVYVNQDDIGSKSFLGLGDLTRYTFTKEVFKYMFNVLDESIAQLEGEISLKSRQVTELNKKYTIISDFLRETDYETVESIDDELNQIDLMVEDLKAALKKLNEEMVADSAQYKELKDAHNYLSLMHKESSIRISSLEDKIEKYSRLKNDYDNDIDKIKAIKIANSRIGQLDEEVYSCPVCDSHIKINDGALPFEISSEKDLDEELGSLSKRRRNINDLITELSLEYKMTVKDKESYNTELQDVRKMIDEESQSMITPFLTQRDTLIKEVSRNEKSREQLVKNLKIRNQQEELLSKHEALIKDINSLSERLDSLKKNAPSMQKILQSLGDKFNRYLRGINIKNRTDVKMCEKFYIPIVRGKEYHRITSGGLRTISSIGYMLAILDYAIEQNINHPMLLIFDTVGKYLGKQTKEKYASETESKEDDLEGMSDPMKYQNIYEQLLETVLRAKNKNAPCQIILVDNDLPESFRHRELSSIVAHYSSIGEDGLPLGLIDDLK